MTQDELKAAYERFDAMSDDAIERLDAVCAALQNSMEGHRAGKHVIVLPNRVCAMLAIEAAEAWEKAEIERE